MVDLHEVARSVAPYGDEERVLTLTRECIANGHRILQIHKLAGTDAEHVSALLALADLPQGAAVLDAGCGVGAVAEEMAVQRPDLRITLLNVSPAQLDLCPPQFPQVAASFDAIPTPAGSFDAVLFLYSLGHGRLAQTLQEASRVLRPGGVVFIYDLAAEDPSRVASTLGYVPHSVGQVRAAAKAAGLQVDMARVLSDTTADQALAYMPPDTFAWLFEGVSPVAYRLVRHD